MRALNDEETSQLHYLCNLLEGRFANAEPGLVNTELDGRDVAVIVAVTKGASGYVLEPLAVLVNDWLMDRMVAP